MKVQSNKLVKRNAPAGPKRGLTGVGPNFHQIFFAVEMSIQPRRELAGGHLYCIDRWPRSGPAVGG